MNDKPHAPTGDEIAQALRHEIKKIELEEGKNPSKTYTILEVLALLYAIRDCN